MLSFQTRIGSRAKQTIVLQRMVAKICGIGDEINPSRNPSGYQIKIWNIKWLVLNSPLINQWSGVLSKLCTTWPQFHNLSVGTARVNHWGSLWVSVPHKWSFSSSYGNLLCRCVSGCQWVHNSYFCCRLPGESGTDLWKFHLLGFCHIKFERHCSLRKDV